MAWRENQCNSKLYYRGQEAFVPVSRLMIVVKAEL